MPKEDDDLDESVLGDGPPDDLDEEDLELGPEGLSEDDLEEELVDDEEELDEGDEGDDDGADVLTTEDEEDYEDEEEEDSDDVEASLDVILKSRLVVSDDEDEEEEEDEDEDEDADGEDRAEPATRVLPKQPGEFVCQSCFLVKNQSQLADPERELCRDCV
jgi:hypothetical protein